MNMHQLLKSINEVCCFHSKTAERKTGNKLRIVQLDKAGKSCIEWGGLQRSERSY